MGSASPSDLAAAYAALGIDSASANGHGWCSAPCPACGVAGAGPSFRVNINNGAYKCHRCGASPASTGKNVHEFVLEPKMPSLKDQTSLSKRDELPELSEAIVERYARFLRDSPSIMSDIERRRGWKAETIIRLSIGWDGGHLWIPIRDLAGNLVNARLYDPFSRSVVKSLHYANDSGLRRTSVWVPFGEKSLEGHSSVWTFEGEPDGILAAQMGFPAAVITGGAGTWCDELPAIIGTKRSVFCYDMDAPGARGARAHCARLRNMGKEALELKFELSDPNTMNDFTDAVMKDHRGADWFRALAKSQWGDGSPPSAKLPMRVRLGGGVPGERMTTRAHVAGTHTVPLLVPQAIIARCHVDWQPDRACRTCPVGNTSGNMRVDVDPESQDLLILAATPAKFHTGEFVRITGAPGRCPCVEFETPVMWQVQPIKLIPPMTDRTGGDSTVRSALCVTPADGRPPPVRANQLYDFDGRVMADVKSNEWTIVSSESMPAEDDVDSFRMTEAKAHAFMAVFHPHEWTAEAVDDAMRREEDSLARHVTEVYGRRILLRALDLTFHSVLSFEFRGRVDARGWMSMGCIGDARCGKSQTFSAMHRHLGFGRLLADANNTTFAGIVGGLQQIGQGDKAWMITWGLIPTNDRGLVIIDEVSSLPVEDIGLMSGMRSSGIAELTKIRSASTPARTRLVMSGNPRGRSATLSSFGTPVEALLDLIGAPEDVARFDIAVALRGGLDKERANEELGPQPMPINAELRRDLVRFAWSRRADQISWEPGAQDHAVALAKKMTDRYDWSVPLVERGEQDLRIARVAVAAAVRTFSVADDNSTVLVRKCHVQFAHDTMCMAYDGDLAYDQYSEMKSRMKLDEAAASKLVLSLGRNSSATARAMLALRRITLNTIGMSLALNAEDARTIIAQLAQIGAAEFSKDGRANDSMVWTPGFVVMLRQIEATPIKREVAANDPF